MKITIIGAGKTGRGFLARLLKENELTFIDKDQELVTALNAAKEVQIQYFGDKKPAETISFTEAMTWGDVAEKGWKPAELILVSVGGSNLNDVGAELKKYIISGQQIIVCENASKPARKLYDAIGIEGVMIAESTVFCTTIEAKNDTVCEADKKEGPVLSINSEWYPYLQFDAEPMKDAIPQVNNLKPVFEFGNFLTRKLYTYNSASCIIAYLGYLKGYTVYSDAANDPEILELLDRNYEIINQCMCLEYGYDPEDQKEFAALSRDKFTDRTIVDTVARNAREPQRKIGATERVTGPLLLQQKYGKDTSVLEKTLAAMLLYRPEEEKEWNRILDEKTPAGVLKELAGLDENSELFTRVLAMASKKL